MRFLRVFIIPSASIIILFLSSIWPGAVNAAGIVLSESQGNVGSKITIEGSGFTGQLATIYWDDSLLAEDIPISDKGTLQYELVIPHAAKGNHVIYIEDDSHWSGSTGSVDFTIFPSVHIFPEFGKELSQVTIIGSGFDSKEENIGITWDGKTQIAVELKADNNGTWNAMFTVPNSSKGGHYFNASGSTTNGDEIGDITFVVTPWAKLEPTTGPIDTKIKIELWGFQTSESGIKLTWDGDTIKSNLTSNTKGDVVTTIEAPESTAGDHIIKVQRKVTTKSGTFPDMNFKVTPAITLQTTTDETVTIIKLKGVGYAKKEQLTISLDHRVINKDISTDSNGSFSAVLQIPETENTDHTITVKDQSGNSSEYNFTMEKIEQLTTPQPMTPKDGYGTIVINSVPDAFLKVPNYILHKELDMPPISFVWSKLDIENGVNYFLQIAADDDFSSPIINEKITTVSEYTVPEDKALLPGNYSWRIKAVNSTGMESPWSHVYKFEISLITTRVILMSIAVLVLAVVLIALIIWRIFAVLARRNRYEW